MWLKKAANLLENVLSPVIPVVGNIGSAIITLIMLLTVADVCGRRVFNRPVESTYELNALLLVVVGFLAVTHCEFLRGHVTIDLLISRLRQRTQDVIDSVMYFFFLATYVLITRQLYLYAVKLFKDNVTAGTIEIPVYPFAYLAAFGSILVCLVVLVHFLLFIAKAVGK